MTARRNQKKTRLTKQRRSYSDRAQASNPKQLALPQEEIRCLVLRSTIPHNIEPFVRQMVRIMDNLKAGRIREVARLTTSKRDESRATLISAISSSAREGNTMAAHETAFLAALYAYENSLDHLRAFMRYLDSLKKSGSRTKGSSVKLR